ncbi:MAG: class I SAM-dependent methyltransferase [Roseovarius sp.]
MSASSRLSTALESGDVTLPEAGRIAVFAPREGMDLSALPADLCHVITTFKPDRDHFAGQGFACGKEPDGRYAASVVCLPRAKALGQALVAEAASVTDGPVIVDGAKTDGVESILKACRKRADVSPALSKSHGKLFHFPASAAFEDWARGAPQEIEGGFVTMPGIFSADGIDPASALLADHLPDKLGRRVADLGAGWGYLSARALSRESIEEIHLVEADFAALDCARRNVLDARAHLHWEDATRWQPEEPLDTVIANPPFHTGRNPDPGLGLDFIRAAARVLSPRGQLFLVANRHLPYETEMARQFGEVKEMGGDNRFKLLHGVRPARRPG